MVPLPYTSAAMVPVSLPDLVVTVEEPAGTTAAIGDLGRTFDPRADC